MVAEKQAVIPQKYEDLLHSKALAHVATIGPHGEPQNNPVWFDWDGQYLYFSQTTTRQKVRNLQNDARIAFSIVDLTNDFRYLEVRGKVVRIDPDPEIAFISKMAKKYMGLDVYPWHREGDERIIIVVEPQHTTQMG